MVGFPRSNISVSNSVFLANSASYGGGMSMHADLTCTTQQLSQGCYNATVDSSCQFLNNSALEGAGGALFWTHPGNLNISCSVQHSLASNATTTMEAEAAVLLSAIPCDSWSGNHVTGAGYGPVAASTSLYLQPTYLELPYYTSNAVLPLQAFAKVGVKFEIVVGVASTCTFFHVYSSNLRGTSDLWPLRSFAVHRTICYREMWQRLADACLVSPYMREHDTCCGL